MASPGPPRMQAGHGGPTLCNSRPAEASNLLRRGRRAPCHGDDPRPCTTSTQGLDSASPSSTAVGVAAIPQ